jgi:hypothetical protein
MQHNTILLHLIIDISSLPVMPSPLCAYKKWQLKNSLTIYNLPKYLTVVKNIIYL